MCGRYYVDDETAKEIEKTSKAVNDKNQQISAVKAIIEE